jgi:hypothetical protein
MPAKGPQIDVPLILTIADAFEPKLHSKTVMIESDYFPDSFKFLESGMWMSSYKAWL